MEEMTKDALHLRNALLEKNQDPAAHVFYVSPEEFCLLLNQPYSDVRLDYQANTFCGLHVLKLYPERSERE